MQVHQREAERLRRVQSLVGSSFPRFGVNKQREIIRLLYEIAKREDIPAEEILRGLETIKFARLKDFLLQRRFPRAYPRYTSSRFYLPRLRLDPENAFQLSDGDYQPVRIYVEEVVSRSSLVERFQKAFPRTPISTISTLKDFISGQERFRIADYNRRGESVFLVKGRHDFFKPCPCTPAAVPCGYHIFNLAFGCLYECTYCYLQEYVNSPGLIFPANPESFFDRFETYQSSPAARNWRRGSKLRVGTGEFSDSLMLEEITGYSIMIIDFFARRSDVLFEFKTKSRNIQNLLEAEHAGNIVVGWSLNPQSVIDKNEFYTASLAERIEAAKLCAEAGYRLAFHFDPIFYYRGWEDDYREVVDRLLDTVGTGKIEWVSLGTLRFKPELKPVIENRFPGNTILDEEQIIGFDGKLRYPEEIRLRIYRKMIEMLKKGGRRLPIYLCMENEAMWDALQLPFPFT